MIEWLIEMIQGLPIWGLFVFTFVITYVEHIFPPSPSDVLLVFIGTVIGIGTIGFTPTLIIATSGSTLGFLTAYWLGRKFGMGLVDKGWLPFVTVNLIEKVEKWFEKYHGLIIVINRFMAGTRAVVAFTAGITKMKLPRTVLYSTLSAILWNALLLWLGMLVGARWREADAYLSTYGWVVTSILVALVVVWFIRRRTKRKSAKAEEPIGP